MDAAKFKSLLRGYKEITIPELKEEGFQKGGHMRYAIETLSSRGRVTETAYKRGGVLTVIDNDLRYIRLMNPYSKVNGRSFSWYVKLNGRPENERIRLWYKPRCQTEEILVFRELMKQIEEGKIKIVRVRQ